MTKQKKFWSKFFGSKTKKNPFSKSLYEEALEEVKSAVESKKQTSENIDVIISKLERGEKLTKKEKESI